MEIYLELRLISLEGEDWKRRAYCLRTRGFVDGYG